MAVDGWSTGPGGPTDERPALDGGASEWTGRAVGSGRDVSDMVAEHARECRNKVQNEERERKGSATEAILIDGAGNRSLGVEADS